MIGMHKTFQDVLTLYLWYEGQTTFSNHHSAKKMSLLEIKSLYSRKKYVQIRPQWFGFWFNEHCIFLNGENRLHFVFDILFVEKNVESNNEKNNFVLKSTMEAKVCTAHAYLKKINVWSFLEMYFYYRDVQPQLGLESEYLLEEK